MALSRHLEGIWRRLLPFGGFAAMVLALPWPDCAAQGPNGDRDARAALREAAMAISHSKLILQRLQTIDDDALQLEGVLSTLCSEEGTGDQRLQSFESLNRLARRKWSRKQGETTRQFVQRNLEELEREPPKLVSALDEYGRRLRSTGRSWPFDWRRQKETWLDLAATIVDPQQAQDADVWGELIEKHPAQADIMRLAYLAAIEAEGAKIENWELVAPLLETPGPADLRIANHAVLLRVLAESDRAVDIDRRAAVRGALLPLGGVVANTSVPYAALQSLLNTPETKEERKALQAELVQNAAPEFFARSMRNAGYDESDLRRLFYGKQVEAKYDSRPLNKVVAALEQQVELPLWIVPAVFDDDTPVTLDRNGPWLEVLLAVLAESSSKLVMLREDVMWIGPAAHREAAEELVRTAFSKASAPGDRGERTLSALLRPAEVAKVVRPEGVVLHDVLSQHGVPYLISEEVAPRLPASLELRGVPLCVALEHACRKTSVSWRRVGPIVVFGTPERMTTYRGVEESFRLTLARMEADDSPLLHQIDKADSLEFIRVPLADVLAYCRDLHPGLELTEPAGARLDHITTGEMVGVSFGWALETVLAEQGLTLSFADHRLSIVKREAKP